MASSTEWRVHRLVPDLHGIERVRCVQVGAGGTGSWVAQMMAGVHVACQDAARAGIAFDAWALGALPWDLVLVDPDTVEAKNVGRQCFGYPDIGRYKAQVLADRLATTHRLTYEVQCLPFDASMLRLEPDTYVVLVGCVDNPAARARMHLALAAQPVTKRHRLLYVDAGNGRDVGQVLLGTTAHPQGLRRMFNPVGLTDRAPAPTLMEPDLTRTPDRSFARHLRNPEDDCAARVLRGEQLITINVLVAAAVTQALTDLILGRVRYVGMDIDARAGLRCLPIELTAATLAAKLSGGRYRPGELDLIDDCVSGPPARVPRAHRQRVAAPEDEDEDDEGRGGDRAEPPIIGDRAEPPVIAVADAEATARQTVAKEPTTEAAPVPADAREASA